MIPPATQWLSRRLPAAAMASVAPSLAIHEGHDIHGSASQPMPPFTPAASTSWRDLAAPLIARVSLRDGRCVRLRPVHPADAAAAQAFVEGLSPQARRRRFHGALKHLPAAALRALTAVDQRSHVAIVAEAGCADGATRLVAEARYVRADAAGADECMDDDEAEFAIVVADDWQGQGLARTLMLRLARHARAQGLLALHGNVLADNAPMLSMMRRLGAAFSGDPFDATVVRVRLPL